MCSQLRFKGDDMKEWYIEDRNNEIYVLHGETYTEKKKIYPEVDCIDDVNFFILYNDNKTVGYQLTYKYDEKYPKFLTYNSFGIVYNKRKKHFKTSFEVIFEDATIRFLTWEHTIKISEAAEAEIAEADVGRPYVRDYFLVGRWRSEVGNNG